MLIMSFMDGTTFPDVPVEYQGPKMQALRDDRRRRFAFIMGCGEENAAEAARAAGYSDVKDGAKVQAHHLMHDPDVLEAVQEVGRKALIGLAPLAVKCAKAILQDKKHRAHARMVEVVFDRTGYIAETEHRVTVTHVADIKELEALARRLALEGGIPVERLIGVNGLDGKSMKTIEHQEFATEVSRETLTEGK